MEKSTWGNKGKHCWGMSTNFLFSKVCWQHSAMSCLYSTCKLCRPYFEFSMKVMGLNSSYLLKSILLYLLSIIFDLHLLMGLVLHKIQDVEGFWYKREIKIIYFVPLCLIVWFTLIFKKIPKIEYKKFDGWKKRILNILCK